MGRGQLFQMGPDIFDILGVPQFTKTVYGVTYNSVVVIGVWPPGLPPWMLSKASN